MTQSQYHLMDLFITYFTLFSSKSLNSSIITQIQNALKSVFFLQYLLKLNGKHIIIYLQKTIFFFYQVISNSKMGCQSSNQASVQQARKMTNQMIPEYEKNHQSSQLGEAMEDTKFNQMPNFIFLIKSKLNKYGKVGQFDNRLWSFLYKQFKKYYFDRTSTNEALDLIQDIISFHLYLQKKSPTNPKQIEQQEKKIGKRVSKLFRTLQSRQQGYANNLKIMAKDEIVGFSEVKTFFSFLFDFSIDPTTTQSNRNQILNKDTNINQLSYIAQKTFLSCKQNYNAIAFLSLYFVKGIHKMYNQQQNSIQQIEKLIKDKIEHLSKVYPEIQINELNNNKEHEELKKFKKENHQLQKVNLKIDNPGNRSKLQLVQDFIIKKSQISKFQHEIFVKIVQKVCRKRGYGFLSGVKIKTKDEKTAIWRTIEKMIEDDRLIQKFKQLKTIYQKKCSTYKKQKIQLKVFIEEQQEQVRKIIQKVVNSQDFVEFNIKDMVRGKCIYQKMESLLETVKDLRLEIENYNIKNPNLSKKIQILELKNEIQKKNMVKIIIQLPNIIAELQLVLKLDKVSNEFNHKLYQLKRSQLYSLTTNLFLHNEKWGKTFFPYLNETLEFIVSNKIKIRTLPQNYNANIIINQKNAFFQKILGYNIKDYTKTNQDTQQNNISHKEKILKILDDQLLKNQTKSKSKRGQLLSLIWLYEGGCYNDQSANIFQKENVQNIQQKDEKLIYANILLSIGNMKLHQSKYNQAYECYNQSLQIRINESGENNIDVANSYNNIGIVYQYQSRYNQALKFLNKSLQIKRNLVGQNSIQVAHSYLNIGYVYEKQSKYNQALQFYNKSLQIKRNIVGQNSLDVAKCYQNIGIVYQSQQKNNQALEYFNKSLQITKNLVGQNSLDVAKCYNNIGLTYSNQSKYKQAIEFHHKSLQIQINLVGQKSLDAANSYFNLTSIYQKLKDYPKSLQYANKAHSIYKSILPQKHSSRSLAQYRVQRLSKMV